MASCPGASLADLPARGRRSGLTEIGLPYAADPAITRHLARFLGQQAGSLHTGGRERRVPSAVLFNGGVFKAGSCAAGCSTSFRAGPGHGPGAGAADLDLAVALGAAYYGRCAAARACAFAAACPRSYYVGIETAAPAVPGVPPPIKALCVVPMGMEEGTETDVPGPEIRPGRRRAGRVPLSRLNRPPRDPAGHVLELVQHDELEELAPLETALEAADRGPASRCRSGCTRG